MKLTINVIGLIFVITTAAAQQSPTALDIFELRRKCQIRAETILNNLAAGPYWHRTAVSNYDIKKHHCYVKIDASPSNPNLPLSEKRYTTHLYDGQTEELLAVTHSEGGKKTYGQIFDEGYAGNPFGYDEASAYIKFFITSDR